MIFGISYGLFWVLVAALALIIEIISLGLSSIWFTGGGIAALAGEADVISDNLDRGAVLAVLRLILTGLELTVYGDQRAFREIAAYKLRGAAPSDDVKKVCLTLFACFHIAAVDRDTERGNGNAGVGCL